MGYRNTGLILAGSITLFSCTTSYNEDNISALPEPPLFEQISSEVSGIQFSNTLQHTERLNAYTYRNFYNGAGVAVGDINNDGLPDIYIAGNQVSNKLYLNKGNFTFEDITEIAGVSCKDVWSTGVSIADVNGDGLDDIYVCKSGPPEGPNRRNELFINNGDLTFTEQAQAYGIDDIGLSHHAVFFDYDLDGDLDMYLLNNSLRSVGIYDLREGQRSIRDPEGGNKLYRNDGKSFTDVSEMAGIYGSAIGFGLGVTASDLNKDGWPDLFVSNDFFERDYLYINQRDGTFREMLESNVTEISMGSMGADIADLTNDGYPEIYVTEMLPATLDRVKTKTVFENWDKYQSNVANGYYHQFTRNVLQLNNGPVPGAEVHVSFSEVSRMTGTEATDWSWGALIFDVNNDGQKDIFVANGIFKDLTDQDYINFYSNTELQSARVRRDSTILTSLIDKIPSVPLNNHLFLNRGNLQFDDGIKGSGLEGPGFSNGAVYADLDNDGDLDLIVNNVNAPLSVYKNLTRENNLGNSIQINFRGPSGNTRSFGSQVYAYAGDDLFFGEQQPVKGYMSTVDSRIHLGIGEHTVLDSIKIFWPDQSYTLLTNVQANQILQLDYNKSPRQTSSGSFLPESRQIALMEERKGSGLDTVNHHENEFIDFNRDRLLFEMYSNEGPDLAVGDINGDGLEDFIMGGSAGYAARIFLQEVSGTFHEMNQLAIMMDDRQEDSGMVLFDADGDRDLDLYIGSGGNEFSYGDPRLLDRLYLNDGSGNFIKAPSFIDNQPRNSTSFVKTLDFDLDGDTDLLVGSRLQPFFYGAPVSAYLLENKGSGQFSEVTKALAPGMIDLGVLTDAVILNQGEGKRPEILIVGEWMPPVLFRWKDTAYEKVFVDAPSGLYKSVLATDLNGDGTEEIILGNFGENCRFRLSDDKPLTLFVGDYDENGTREHILAMYEGDSLFPLVLLQDLAKQVPVIRKNFQTFDSYKKATMADIFSKDKLSEGYILEVTSLQSGILMKAGNKYQWKPLPKEAQIAPAFALYAGDLNKDGHNDLIIGGNQSRAKPELGIYTASYGVVLIGDGQGNFQPLPPVLSGLWMRGDIRDIREIRSRTKKDILFSRNNKSLKLYTIK
jgi:hypothetical protein